MGLKRKEREKKQNEPLNYITKYTHLWFGFVFLNLNLKK